MKSMRFFPAAMAGVLAFSLTSCDTPPAVETAPFQSEGNLPTSIRPQAALCISVQLHCRIRARREAAQAYGCRSFNGAVEHDLSGSSLKLAYYDGTVSLE